MTSELNEKFPKAPGLTLEQARELSKKIKEFKDELDSDGVAVYPNWPNKIKTSFPGELK